MVRFCTCFICSTSRTYLRSILLSAAQTELLRTYGSSSSSSSFLIQAYSNENKLIGGTQLISFAWYYLDLACFFAIILLYCLNEYIINIALVPWNFLLGVFLKQRELKKRIDYIVCYLLLFSFLQVYKIENSFFFLRFKEKLKFWPRWKSVVVVWFGAPKIEPFVGRFAAWQVQFLETEIIDVEETSTFTFVRFGAQLSHL